MRLAQRQQEALTNLLYHKFGVERQETIESLSKDYRVQRDAFLSSKKAKLPKHLLNLINRSRKNSATITALYKEQNQIGEELKSNGINPNTYEFDKYSCYGQMPNSLKELDQTISRMKQVDDSMHKANKVVLSIMISDNQSAMDILAQHGIDLAVKPAIAIEKAIK